MSNKNVADCFYLCPVHVDRKQECHWPSPNLSCVPTVNMECNIRQMLGALMVWMWNYTNPKLDNLSLQHLLTLHNI